jgi:two-component system, chemotaxis family, CheB/CheR fusion protein
MPQKLAIGIVSRQTRHLARMVDDLRDLTGIDHGKIELRRRKVDLNDLVRAVVSDHDAFFESKASAARFRFPRLLCSWNPMTSA